VGAASKGVKPTKVKKILDTKIKAEPKKRKKRGVLKKKDVGKKKAVTKRLKKKKVSFSAKGRKSMGLRREQERMVEIEGRKDRPDRRGPEFPANIRAAAVAPRRRYGRATPGRFRVRSDRQRIGWEVNAQGQLMRAPARKRRITIV